MSANPASVECRQVAPPAIKQRHFPPSSTGTGCCPNSTMPPCLDYRCRKPPSARYELARALSRNRGTGMEIYPMLPAWKASVLRLSHGAPVIGNVS